MNSCLISGLCALRFSPLCNEKALYKYPLEIKLKGHASVNLAYFMELMPTKHCFLSQLLKWFEYHQCALFSRASLQMYILKQQMP